ncbi:MAG: hypothetical protein AAF354_14140 [Pseudomonadota bacterium]
MWDMFTNSVTLFFQGSLFADPPKVYRQIAIGAAAIVILLFLLASIGLPVWLAAIVAGLCGGVLQPYLFKDLKYR